MKPQNKKASQVTKGLIEYLKKTGQLQILPQLVKETLRKTQTEKDPSRALVTSAIALDENEIAELKTVLSAQAGLDVTIENKVDPDIIAGLRIKIGDKLIDNTMKQKLLNLSEKLSQ